MRSHSTGLVGVQELPGGFEVIEASPRITYCSLQEITVGARDMPDEFPRPLKVHVLSGWPKVLIQNSKKFNLYTILGIPITLCSGSLLHDDPHGDPPGSTIDKTRHLVARGYLTQSRKKEKLGDPPRITRPRKPRL